jgi:hypothetical protein
MESTETSGAQLNVSLIRATSSIETEFLFWLRESIITKNLKKYNLDPE